MPQRLIHQPAAGTLPLHCRGDAEIGELDVGRLATVELEQPFVLAILHQCVDLDHGVADGGQHLVVRQCQSSEPQPIGADAAEQAAVPVKIRLRDAAQG